MGGFQRYNYPAHKTRYRVTSQIIGGLVPTVGAAPQAVTSSVGATAAVTATVTRPAPATVSASIGVTAAVAATVTRPGGTYALPSNRVATWNPGRTAVGGIPTGQTIYTTLNPLGGATDDTVQIQTALTNCPSGQVVKLGPGKFNISTNGLTITRSGVVLRGSGPGPGNWAAGTAASGSGGTYLVKATGSNDTVIRFGTQWSPLGTATNLTANAVKGANSVTVASTAGLSSGTLVIIDSLTDTSIAHIPSAAVTPLASAYYEEANRPTGQVMEVDTVVGSTVTFTTSFYLDHLTSNTAHLVALGSPVRNSGVEDLYCYGGEGADGGGGIHLWNCGYCWVKHVESTWTMGTSITMDACFRCEIRDSYIHDSRAGMVNGGNSYGFGFNRYTADCLLENCISIKFNKVIIGRSAGGGNVVGYNYMDDGTDTNGAWFEYEMGGSHFPCSSHFLFEGNQSANYGLDDHWGNSVYATVFRNHLTGVLRDYPTVDPRRAVEVSHWHWWQSFIGNVLGTPSHPGITVYELLNTTYAAGYMWEIGVTKDDATDDSGQTVTTCLRDGNYDYLTNQVHWHGIGGTGSGNGLTPPMDSTLPDSLYLSSAPSFFSGVTWPWVDGSSTVTPLLGSLPARTRYDANTPNDVPTGGPVAISAFIAASATVASSVTAVAKIVSSEGVTATVTATVIAQSKITSAIGVTSIIVASVKAQSVVAPAIGATSSVSIVIATPPVIIWPVDVTAGIGATASVSATITASSVPSIAPSIGTSATVTASVKAPTFTTTTIGVIASVSAAVVAASSLTATAAVTVTVTTTVKASSLITAAVGAVATVAPSVQAPVFTASNIVANTSLVSPTTAPSSIVPSIGANATVACIVTASSVPMVSPGIGASATVTSAVTSPTRTSSAIASTVTVAASVTAIGAQAVSSSVGSITAVVAAVSATAFITSSIGAQSTASATIVVAPTLTAAIGVTSTVTASARATSLVTAAMSATANLSTAVQAGVPQIVPAIGVTATVTCAVVAAPTISVTIGTVTTSAATVVTPVIVASSIGAVTSVIGTLVVPSLIASSIGSTVTLNVTAVQAGAPQVVPTINATSALTAVVSSNKPLAATVSSTATIAASVTIPAQVVATLGATTQVTSSFKISQQMSPLISSTVQAVATLKVGQRVSPTIQASVSMSGLVRGGGGVFFSANVASTSSVTAVVAAHIGGPVRVRPGEPLLSSSSEPILSRLTEPTLS